MISHKHKCIFIHNPKCAGNSIAKSLEIGQYAAPARGSLEYKLQYHQDLLTHKKLINEHTYKHYYKFSIVRNPFDRVVSAYFWYKQTDRKDNKHVRRVLPDTFSEYVLNLKELQTLPAIKKHSHFFCQYDTVFNGISSDLDFIGRFETIESDIDDISRDLHIDKIVLPHINKKQHRHYREYYNQDTIDIVEDLFKNDLKHFKYTF